MLGPGRRGATAGVSATLMDGAPWGLLGAAGGGAGGFVCCRRRCRELASARASVAPHRPAAAPHHPPHTALEPSTAGTEALGAQHESEPRGAPGTRQHPPSPAGTCQTEAGPVAEDPGLWSELLATSVPRARRQLARHAPQPQVPGSGWHGRPGQRSPARGTGRERSAGIHSLRSPEQGGFLCGLGFVCAGAWMNGPFSLCRHVCRGSPCAGQASNKRSRRGAARGAARRGLPAAPHCTAPAAAPRLGRGRTAALDCTARAWAHSHPALSSARPLCLAVYPSPTHIPCVQLYTLCTAVHPSHSRTHPMSSCTPRYTGVHALCPAVHPSCSHTPCAWLYTLCTPTHPMCLAVHPSPCHTPPTHSCTTLTQPHTPCTWLYTSCTAVHSLCPAVHPDAHPHTPSAWTVHLVPSFTPLTQPHPSHTPPVFGHSPRAQAAAP